MRALKSLFEAALAGSRRRPDIRQRRIDELEAALARAVAQGASAEASAAIERRALDDRLDRLAHELRTPLNAVVGFCDGLARDARAGRLDRRQTEAVERVSAAAARLKELIENAFTDEGAPGGLRRIDPGVVLSRVICELGDPRVIPPRPRAGLVVLADEARLATALIDLLRAALHVARPGERLEVGIEPLVDGARVSLPPVAMEPRTLTEVRRAVSGWNAVLEVTSARTTLDLPGLARDRLGSRSVVLYVEDNPANVALVRQILQACVEGARLHAAPTGAAGLVLARELMPDLILLDINLPDMDGWAVRRALADDPMTRNIPVAALTANAAARHARRGAEAGFAAWLTKPLELPALLAVLAAHLGDHETAHAA